MDCVESVDGQAALLIRPQSGWMDEWIILQPNRASERAQKRGRGAAMFSPHLTSSDADLPSSTHTLFCIAAACSCCPGMLASYGCMTHRVGAARYPTASLSATCLPAVAPSLLVQSPAPLLCHACSLQDHGTECGRRTPPSPQRQKPNAAVFPFVDLAFFRLRFVISSPASRATGSWLTVWVLHPTPTTRLSVAALPLSPEMLC